MPDGKQQRTQEGLLDFLQADIDLCSTILGTACLTSDHNHFAMAIKRVTDGIETIRNFLRRVEDERTSQAISAKADALEGRMLSLVQAGPL